MTGAYLVTGKTYQNRRALRALGAVWQIGRAGFTALRATEPGYALPLDKIDEARRLEGLTFELAEFIGNPFAPLSPDELRDYRQARIDRRAARLLTQADAADRRADEARNRIKPHERDFLSLHEPVKRGHHSQRRHENLIARANKSFEDAGRESHNAAQLRRRAENLQGARVAGDAERERQEARAAARDAIEIGDHVKCIIMGAGIVSKVHKVTMLVTRADGHTFKAAPEHLTLIAKGEGKAPDAPARLFKAGDAALWHRHGAANKAHCKPFPVVILRATPRGYSVMYSLPGIKPGTQHDYKATARAIDLEAAP